MPRLIALYVRVVDRVNRWIGLVVMYSIFVLVAILLWSSVSKTFFLESAQFAMAAYFILGGAYAIQVGSHVRMDLFYGAWRPRTRAWVDAFTALFLIFFLVVLLYGGIGSTLYSITYNERSATAWRPLMWPIKTVMCFGIFMMILQTLSEFFKDIARIRGHEL